MMRLYAAGRPWGDILPRYSFLEPLLAGKRVLEVGCGEGSGARFLAERGAGQVVGVEREGPSLDEALAGAGRDGLGFKAFDGRRLDFPSANFDVVIAFDLAERMDPGLLSEIERVLDPNGYLVTALRNPEHLPFSRLVGQNVVDQPVAFERFVAGLQERFARVSVFAQTPFVGFSIGWMDADDQELPLEMDSGLLPDGSEDVAFYLAICGREPVSLDSQSLVQLPYCDLVREVSEGLSEGEPAGADELAERDSWLEALRGDVERIERQVARRDSRIDELQKTVDRLQRERLDLDRSRSDQEALTASLREENKGLKQAIEEVGRQLQDSRGKQAALESEQRQRSAADEQRRIQIDELRRQAEQLRREIQDRVREIDKGESLVSRLQQRLDAAGEEHQRLLGAKEEVERRTGRLQGLLAAAGDREDQAAQEQEVLQAEMADREEELLQLRHRLTEETGQRADLEQSLSDQVARNRELDSDLVDLVNRLQDGQEQDYDRVRSMEELNRRLVQQHQDLEEAREKIDELTRELYVARRQEEDLTAAIDLMRSTMIDQEKAHRRSLGEEMDRMRVESEQHEERAREALEMAAERERTLQARLATMQKQMAELEDQTSLELSSLGEQIRRREEQMLSLTERLAQMDEKKTCWEDRAAQLEQRLAEMENQ